MADGIDVRGYLHWSALDNYEWGSFAPTFGLMAWDFGPDGQPPVVSGIDVVLVRDGRIATMHTMLTSTPG